MGSITRAQALLLSHPDVRGSYLKQRNSDQLLPRIPKFPIRGDGLQVASVNVLGGAAFVSSGGATDADATSYDAAAREFELRRIAAKVEISGDIAQNVSMINDVMEQQIQAKMISMWDAVGDQLIYGDGVDPDPVGLVTFAAEHPAGVLNGGGTAITLARLNEMIASTFPWDGGQPRYFVMNRGQFARVTALATSAGFELATYPDAMLGKPMAHYRDVGILVSDWILNNEDSPNNRTSIYLVHLGPREGETLLGGLVWFYNEDTGAGIRVDGPHRTSAATDTLFADLELNIGFATLSTNAVLRYEKLLV